MLKRRVLGNSLAPFRFLTPFSIPSSRRLPNSLLLGEGQWLKKPFEGKAGMVPLQDGEESEA